MPGGYPRAYKAGLQGRYPIVMMTLSPSSAAHRKIVSAAITSVLSPAELTMVHQFMAAERPGRPAPQPEELLTWIRMNMPAIAQNLDHVLYPGD